MKLKYNLLCIDDDLERLREIKEEFEDFNSNVGIEIHFEDVPAKILPVEKANDHRDRIKNDIADRFANNQAFEIILVDLHLGPKGDDFLKGSDIISVIRDAHSRYRPIIFYSSGRDPELRENAAAQLDLAAKDAEIYGQSVFTVPFEDLSTFLERIAKEMHKEEQKINHVRGLLMDQVSELDAHIIKAISIEKLWDSIASKNDQQEIEKEFKDRVKSSHNTAKKLFDDTESMNYEEIKKYILENDRKVNTFTKTKVLRKILQLNKGLKEQGDILSQAIHGPTNIVDVRNAYGHQTADILSDSHDDDKCKYIREESRRQVQNIKKVTDSK